MIRQLLRLTVIATRNARTISVIPQGFNISARPVLRRLEENDFDIADDMVETLDPSKIIKALTNRAMVTQKFKYLFDCTEQEAQEIVGQNKVLLRVPIAKIEELSSFLFEKQVTVQTIKENPWLLAQSQDFLENKLQFVQNLQPRNINDFIPFLQLSQSKLQRLYKKTRKEQAHIPEGNRVYYFSNRLEVKPVLVAKYFATHLFMFDVSFDMLVENLNIMLEYKIAPISILKDLWAFKYLPKSIRARLDRCQKASKDNLKPWMIRCPESVLQRSLKLSQDSKSLLSEDYTIVDYLSDRLGYDTETTKHIISKHEPVVRVRITKIKEILDYLLDEEKFQPYEIANVPRILCHSLETTKKRLDELKSYHCRPTSLVIVCKSQNEYQKFLNIWIDGSNKSATV